MSTACNNRIIKENKDCARDSQDRYTSLLYMAISLALPFSNKITLEKTGKRAQQCMKRIDTVELFANNTKIQVKSTKMKSAKGYKREAYMNEMWIYYYFLETRGFKLSTGKDSKDVDKSSFERYKETRFNGKDVKSNFKATKVTFGGYEYIVKDDEMNRLGQNVQRVLTGEDQLDDDYVFLRGSIHCNGDEKTKVISFNEMLDRNQFIQYILNKLSQGKKCQESSIYVHDMRPIIQEIATEQNTNLLEQSYTVEPSPQNNGNFATTYNTNTINTQPQYIQPIQLILHPIIDQNGQVIDYRYDNCQCLQYNAFYPFIN